MQRKKKVEDLVKNKVDGNHITSRGLIEKVSPNLFPPYTILELSKTNIPKRPSIAKKESKIEGERLFCEAAELLAKVLPDQGDRKDTLRKWVHRESKNVLFFHVAIDKQGAVVGTSLTDYIPEMNIAFFLRVAVDKEHRGQGIAKLLVKERIWSANQEAEKRGRKGIRYVVTEIARPAIYGNPEESHNFMRNVIRLKYHKEASKLRAIAAPNGEIIGSKWYIFTINTIKDPDSKLIPAREAARILHWYYLNYNGYGKTPYGREEIVRIFNQIAWRPELSWRDFTQNKSRVIKSVPEHLMLELKPLTEAAMADKKVVEYLKQQKNAGKIPA